MPTMSFTGGNVIPYILARVQSAQLQEHVKFFNIVKYFANHNVCYNCGFGVEDWHTSAIRCNKKKRGHQDSFNDANYMQYERTNHPFCCKAVHKTMCPNF